MDSLLAAWSWLGIDEAYPTRYAHLIDDLALPWCPSTSQRITKLAHTVCAARCAKMFVIRVATSDLLTFCGD